MESRSKEIWSLLYVTCLDIIFSKITFEFKSRYRNNHFHFSYNIVRVRSYFLKPVTINSRSCYVKLLLYFTEWRTEIILPTTRTTKNKLPSPRKTLLFFSCVVNVVLCIFIRFLKISTRDLVMILVTGTHINPVLCLIQKPGIYKYCA